MQGINITGKVMIFKDKNGDFRTTIGKKDLDGNWENMGIPLTFAGGTPKDLRDRDLIDIKGFLSFFKTKNNIEVVNVIVMEYRLSKNDNLPF